MAEPLLSVGIPTYNRAGTLRRAAASVLAQTHRELELVISDNASADETQALCEELAASDARVRYLRQPINRGPTANFNTLFAQMRGEFAMVLSDDDWLSADYLERCLQTLLEHPELVLACGVARYLREEQVAHDGRMLDLLDARPADRVLGYLAEVDENGVFYGLVRREALSCAGPLRNVLGNDWLLAAAVAAQGRLVTLPDTHVFRELGGTSADIPKLVRTLELPRWQARVPHLVIAAELVRDVCGRAPAYRSLSTGERAKLAARGALAVIEWRSLAWHLTMPSFASLHESRRLRWVWRAYASITRRLGAGG